MASEVDNSAKSVPKAIAWSLAIVVSVYLAIGILLPQKLGKNLGGVTDPHS